MAYSISKDGGRFSVTSPKGKLWKTTYASVEAAEKAVAYIEGRFAGDSSLPGQPSISEESSDTSAERKKLGIPLLPANDEDTEGW